VTPLPIGAVELRGVTRRFRRYSERNQTLKETLLRRKRGTATDLWVLRDVDLDVAPGEAFGIVGRNGTGKSTLLKLVAEIIRPQSGTVASAGRVTSLLELGAGFHPDFTGRENVVMQGTLYGLSTREIERRLDEIVAFAELADFVDMPVRTYSSGMFMRLAFAVAAHVDADIMLLDEVLAVGDAAFQRKCIGRIFEHRKAGGTLLFVSHDQAAVERVCDRAILLDGGEIAADGVPADVFVEYNRRLLGASPLSGPGSKDGEIATGSWGTGRVRIQAVRLLGRDGPCERFTRGDVLRVEMDVESSSPVDMPVYGLDIVDDQGRVLYAATTRGHGTPTGTMNGPTRVAFAIDPLPLLEGSFAISLRVMAADDAELYQTLEQCLRFNVLQQGSGTGPVAVDGSWEITPGPGVAASQLGSATTSG
jgi:ABC-2 type transport system ATP-binding protein